MDEHRFRDAVERMPELFDQLMSCDVLGMTTQKSWRELPAVYVFYDSDEQPCHTGRTRNLQQRVRAHTANSHNSASFAFKCTRQALNLKATYRPEGSRANLMKDPTFMAEFDRQRKAISLMKLRFVRIDCPIEQHLFEVYAALRLGTSLTEFTTS
jgi:predicted GIY-YIG superfamily endonuclease